MAGSGYSLFLRVRLFAEFALFCALYDQCDAQCATFPAALIFVSLGPPLLGLTGRRPFAACPFAVGGDGAAAAIAG